MKKSIFATISNVIFIFFLSFFLVSIISSKTFIYPTNLLFGLYISLIVLLISIIIAKKNVKARKQKSLEENKITRIVYSLSFMSKRKGLAIFYNEIVKRDKGAKLYQNKIVLSNGCSVYNLFSFSPITKADLVKCFNLSNAKKSIILCESAPKEVKDFAKAFKGKIEIKEKAEIFKSLSPSDFNIDDAFTPVDFNKKDKPNFRALISKKNAKKFLAFGLFFIVTSFFVPIKTYYLIIGISMLVYSIFILIFSKVKV